MSSMPERMENELRGRARSAVTELVLDNCISGGQISGVTEEFTALSLLSLIGTNISSLSNMPSLPSLRRVRAPQTQQQ